MRRPVAIIALAGLLAGCSFPDTSVLDDPEPVQQHVVLEVSLENARPEFYDLDVMWLDGDAEANERVPGDVVWKRNTTLTWPDQYLVYAEGDAAKKPGVDDLLAYAQGVPYVHCSITINGRVVVKSDLGSCRFDLGATPIPVPSG
ncbi:hypothetical protein SAMN05421874_14110 [Nonomuraea maritima]|uniref:Lipoprotein n=1 Tax=Nonomuraea maritima TaxID=683260 RepID=A0A1G9QVK3_9ACTN|nr:hypothetical protein [Nonomuraea maritima]SDM15046.1 hypothetical protein SAMN05421874_14110 [Nonomuraea maritima]